MTAFELETVQLDLPAVAGAFGRRLHAAGVPVTAERSARFAAALALVRPVARRRLYWTARAVFVSDHSQTKTFNAVFAAVFGFPDERAIPPSPDADTVATAPDEREHSERPHAAPRPPRPNGVAAAGGAGRRSRADEQRDAEDVEVPTVASDEELLQHKHFDALEPHELAELYRMMARLRLATPTRRTRRAHRDQRGNRIDLRRTLRASLRTGCEPVRLARKRRQVVRRRIVMLCDISGSMEPYARAYLQFLTCARSSGAGGSGSEAFAFATRLTRLTRALASRDPERAIQRAAAAAPDWASGTRIGDALKTFNDRHGRRGMARGAVIVILSDGWERGDPMLVGREMERLARLAYRVVWVNPRASAPGFAPRAGGMAAALPHCDALVSGHSLHALQQVVDAIACERADDAARGATWRPPEPVVEPEQEPWGSATPVQGSSIAMPSGYGPSRGNTTPGWRTP
ncbi:MAG: vWA domain-containing protein [Solirubrobacteraceae bacterium]